MKQPENMPDGISVDVFAVSCVKSGKNITISFNIRGTIESSKTFLTLFTLPEAYIPKRNLYESYITQEGYIMMCCILNTGEVQVYAKDEVKNSFFLRKVITYC